MECETRSCILFKLYKHKTCSIQFDFLVNTQGVRIFEESDREMLPIALICMVSFLLEFFIILLQSHLQRYLPSVSSDCHNYTKYHYNFARFSNKCTALAFLCHQSGKKLAGCAGHIVCGSGLTLIDVIWILNVQPTVAYIIMCQPESQQLLHRSVIFHDQSLFFHLLPT